MPSESSNINGQSYFLSLITSSQNNNYDQQNNEFERYLQLPLIVNQQINPLNWWKTHQTEFPILAKIAKDYLAIQATSVPCEQPFSLANNTIRKTISRLHPQTARACICLKSWLVHFLESNNTNDDSDIANFYNKSSESDDIDDIDDIDEELNWMELFDE